MTSLAGKLSGLQCLLRDVKFISFSKLLKLLFVKLAFTGQFTGHILRSDVFE